MTVDIGIPDTAELAVIVAWPVPAPVTGMVTLVAPAGMTTDDGTEATAVLLEPRVTVRPPAGAAPDNVRVKVPVVEPVIVNGDGEKLRVATTGMGELSQV